MVTFTGIRIKTLQKQRKQLQSQLGQVEQAITALSRLGGVDVRAAGKPARKRHKMSAAARAKIGAAQRARWAKQKAKPAKKKRKMSAAGRAAIRAAQKARWAKIRAAKK